MWIRSGVARGAVGVAMACTTALTVVPAPAEAQPDPNLVPVILSVKDGGSCRLPQHGGFRAFERRREKMQGRVLALTGCEVWLVPKAELEAFTQAPNLGNVDVTVLERGGDQAFREADPAFRPDASQQQLIDAISAAAATVGVRIVLGSPPAVLEFVLTKPADDSLPRVSPRITVALGDGSSRTVVRTSVEINDEKVVWRGMVTENGGSVTLIWWPSGTMAGTIQSEGRLLSLRHLGGRVYAVVEMSPKRMPDEHAPALRRLRGDDPSQRDDPLVRQGDASILRRRNAAGGGTAGQGQGPVVAAPVAPATGADLALPAVPAVGEIVIDVMVAYTRKVKAQHLDVRRELVDLSIEEANNSFRLSGLGHIRLRLAHAYETDYVEEGQHYDHLYRMIDRGDGQMEEVHRLRDEHAADVVLLIVDDAKGCGLASRVYADADDAFAVVHHECAVANYSLAHEVGHLIGARHEVAVDPSQFPFPYGHGYVSGTKWRDIMSSKSSCGGCERVPVWSSPHVSVRGEPAGSPDADNARVIAAEALRVARFRQPSQPVGTGRQPSAVLAPVADR